MRLRDPLTDAFNKLGIAAGIVEPEQKRTLEIISFTTVSMLAFLFVHAGMKQSKVKENEMDLMSKAIVFACVALCGSNVKPEHLIIKCTMNLLGDGPTEIMLVLMPNKFVSGMPHLVEKIPQLQVIWDMIKDKNRMGIAGRDITSCIQHPLMEDLIFFLMYLHKNRTDLMDVFAYSLIKGCLECLATLLEVYVMEHVVTKQAQPDILPRLYGRKGQARITDATSKMAWVKKLTATKFHNNCVSKLLTKDILPVRLQTIFEHASVICYLNRLKEYFQTVRRIHLSMDESNHTEATLVTTVYSPQNNIAAYAPIIVMQKATLQDLDLDELKQLASEAKLVRLASFMYIKSLHQVLAALGHDFDTYKLPPSVIARPLGADELRFRDPITKKFMIKNSTTGITQFQVPQDFAWASVPLLAVCNDQAQTGLACNQFLMEKIGLMMLLFYDKFHRVLLLVCLAG